MGNDTLGSIVLAQAINIVDASDVTRWTVICKDESPWTTLPRDFRPTTECNKGT